MPALIYANPGFDLLRDFAPISALARIQSVLVVNPKRLDVSTLEQFIGARAQGSPTRSTSARRASARCRISRSNCCRTAPASSCTTCRIATARRRCRTCWPARSRRYGRHRRQSAGLRARSGKLRVLGVADRRRAPILPDVPTLDEAGLKDFRAIAWFALFAPKRTPVDVLDRMQTAVQEALAADDVKSVLGGAGRQGRAREPRRLRGASSIRRSCAGTRIAKAANMQLE